jgi:plastocyanin
MKSLPALAAGALVLAALGPGALVRAQATAAPKAATVTIKGDAFTPATIHVGAGQTVTFVNGDNETHTFTSDTAAFDSKNVDANGHFAHTFTKSGSYPYHCAIHTFMKGTIVVEPAGAKQ